MNMIPTKLQAALQNLPENAPEAVVEQLFVSPILIEALGFQSLETYPQYVTGNGRRVDYALRKNTENNIFMDQPLDPHVLIESKGRDYNLDPKCASYRKVVDQLKQYLLSPNCQSAQWGIITNSIHIQLFRKHGKVVHPVTSCLLIETHNIEQIVNDFREKISCQNRCLIVAIYNNKGGVGKTTTTINLASVLKRKFHKEVLTIDLDPNQQDLTKSLGLSLCDGKFYNFLTNRDSNIQECINTFYISRRNNEHKFFDVIPADKKLAYEVDEAHLNSLFKIDSFRQKLDYVKSQYDYILIDAPPNWRIFSRLAVYAADVVFIPLQHNNLFSLENAALTIKEFIPEAQKERGDGGPIALPVFFNGERTTQKGLSVANKTIEELIVQGKREGFDLRPYFYPKQTQANGNNKIFEIPRYANIANSAFARIPAAYRDRTAHEYYSSLAKEYFIQ